VNPDHRPERKAGNKPPEPAAEQALQYLSEASELNLGNRTFNYS